jgi:hypothetical protein
MDVSTILLIVWLHFVADFLMQTDKMAQNKSSSHKWLAFHVAVYAIPFTLFFGFVYAIVNFVLHYATDAVSSRITKRLAVTARETGNWHWFFAVIGLDQAIHYTCLFLTYFWLVQ